jgi:hypothetical protein
VVATVGTGAASGNAQILQNGVMRNSVPFQINVPYVVSVTPGSGAPGTSVRITGTGFGTTQGSGTVWLGSTAGQVTGWRDTEVTASVAPGAVTGIARVQQNGVWSNAVAFPVPNGSGASLTPNLLNLVAGDTHNIAAVNPTGQPLTGLSWTSSDPAIVSLSSDDPPVLTAVAAGHATITAGSASADITVSTSDLALGTVQWSNPGNGSGVAEIVPAVPSANGVADVFAFQYDWSVQAITSDGVTAWQADATNIGRLIPDFNGGLVGLESTDPNSGNLCSIVQFSGLMGQKATVYSPVDCYPGAVVSTDGTIFARKYSSDHRDLSMIAVNPLTGTQVSVQLAQGDNALQSNVANDIIIAGDGYAYMGWSYVEPGTDHLALFHVRLFRMNGAGDSSDIDLYDQAGLGGDLFAVPVHVITNADQGVVATLTPEYGNHLMAVVTGGTAAIGSAPVIGGQAGSVDIEPVLQAEDGSFVGKVLTGDPATMSYDEMTPYMVAFDQSGSVRWTVANEEPQTILVDNGAIGGSGAAYDASGSAFGLAPGALTFSRTSPVYSGLSQVLVDWIPGTSWWPFQRGTYNGTAGIPVDETTDKLVKGEYLNSKMWAKFRTSSCEAVFAAPRGIAAISNYGSYYLASAKDKLRRTHFYNVDNPKYGRLTIRQVTGGRNANNIGLLDWLNANNANAGTLLDTHFDDPTPVAVHTQVLFQAKPEFTLAHELILHAYANAADNTYLQNAFFQSNGLVPIPNSNASTPLTQWMSADCTCTPGAPGSTCPANTAGW